MTQLFTTKKERSERNACAPYLRIPLPGMESLNVMLPARFTESNSSNPIIWMLQCERAVLTRCLKSLEGDVSVANLLIPALKKFNPNGYFDRLYSRDSSADSEGKVLLYAARELLTKTLSEGAVIGAVFVSLSSQPFSFFEALQSGMALSVAVTVIRGLVLSGVHDQEKFLNATSIYRRSLSVLWAGINGPYSTIKALLELSKAKFGSSAREAKSFLAPYMKQLESVPSETESRCRQEIKQYIIARQGSLNKLLNNATTFQTISSAWSLNEMLHGHGKPKQSFLFALTSGLAQLSKENYRQLIDIGLEKFVAERELDSSESGYVALESCKQLKDSLTDADWKVACDLIDFRVTEKIPVEK